MSAFDLARADGLAAFLMMQRNALAALQPFPAGASCTAMAADLQRRADADLAAMGCPLPHGAPVPGFTPAALAFDYLLAGSRLGSAILKSRWLANGASPTRRFTAYFESPSYIDNWRTFCDTATAIDASDPAANEIVRDAIALFDLYHACATCAEGQRLTEDA